MEKKKDTQIVVTVILAIAVVIMSIGFAIIAYNQVLNIEGINDVKYAKWDIHFDSDSYQEKQNSKKATTKRISNNLWHYEVVLEKPGDFYEATVDIVNEGTFDASLNEILISGISEQQSKYIKYSVTYNDNSTYKETKTNLTEETLKAKNGSHPVTVKVEYIRPNNYNDLPTDEDVRISITTVLNYIQIMNKNEQNQGANNEKKI